MEQNKKLSLKEEMEKEAIKIEQEIAGNPDLEHVKVSDKLEASLLAKIQAYENRRAGEYGKKDGTTENTHNEFAEEPSPNFSECTNDSNVVHLSKEDMKALRLGRELLKKKNEGGELFEVNMGYHKHLNSGDNEKAVRDLNREKTRRFRIPKKKRLVVALVAVFVLVLATGMTSIGSKSYLKEFLNGLLGNQSAHKINVKDMDVQETEDGDELTAYREIREKLGFVPVRIGYKPENMKLKDVIIDEEQRKATLFFKNNGEIIRYMIYENESDSSLGQNEEDELIDSFDITTKKQTVKVSKYQIKGYENYRYISDFSYQGVHYQLKGVMKEKEFENIVKSLIYLKKNE